MAARKILSSSQSSTKTDISSAPSPDQVRKALDKVCELKGVGPATGTLLLSIFDPVNVPFFEDELYAWLCPDAKDKLKYNVKEYFELFGRFQQSLAEVLKQESRSLRYAEAFEKIAFIVEHWDCIGNTDKAAIEQVLMHNETKDGHANDGPQSSDRKDQTLSLRESQAEKSSTALEKPSPTKPAKRNKTEDKAQAQGARRSKRLKT